MYDFIYSLSVALEAEMFSNGAEHRRELLGEGHPQAGLIAGAAADLDRAQLAYDMACHGIINRDRCLYFPSPIPAADWWSPASPYRPLEDDVPDFEPAWPDDEPVIGWDDRPIDLEDHDPSVTLDLGMFSPEFSPF